LRGDDLKKPTAAFKAMDRNPEVDRCFYYLLIAMVAFFAGTLVGQSSAHHTPLRGRIEWPDFNRTTSSAPPH
jgi:hypothetical protein